MREAFKQLANLHLNAEFLAQFTRQAFLKGFVRLAFSAGKFPQPAQMRAGVTLGDQKFSPAKDEARRNLNDQ